MEFRRVLALRGANIWARSTVLETLLDLGAWQHPTPEAAERFRSRMADWLPAIEQRAGGEACKRLHNERPQPSAQPEALTTLTLALQTFSGATVSFSRVERLSDAHTYRVVIEFDDEDYARLCLDAAREICLAAFGEVAFDVEPLLVRLQTFADRYCLGPSTRAMVRVAAERGVPARRLNDRSLVQLGHGVHQHRLNTAETDHTSAIAEQIAQDKDLTKVLLRAAGVPVPEGRPVTSEDDAWQAACEVGLPVVVKPQDANHGRGVAINLTRREQVTSAYRFAVTEGEGVIVERYVRGAEHRLLVVADRMVAALRGEPEEVTGDGAHTVRQLVDELNRDPRRGEYFVSPLGIVYLDDIALLMLEQQGYTPDAVPPAGSNVVIHRNGDYTIDETDEVHPDVAFHAVLAARAVGLNVAGIDIIAESIGRSLGEQAGAIVEVNAGPSLQMHLQPQHGTPRPVDRAIVDTIFPVGVNGRVPIVAVAETPASSCTARLIAKMLWETGKNVALTCSQGAFVGSRRVRGADCREATSARSFLLNPMVEAAVFEAAEQSVLMEGLGFDACNTAVIQTSSASSPPASGANAGPGERSAHQAFLQALTPGGCLVLNADDAAVASLADQFGGSLIAFSQNYRGPLVDRLRAHGGRLVLVRNQDVFLVEGSNEQTLVALTSVPMLNARRTNGNAGGGIDDVLAAVAAAWSLEMSVEQIRTGLLSFQM